MQLLALFQNPQFPSPASATEMPHAMTALGGEVLEQSERNLSARQFECAYGIHCIAAAGMPY
jgi:hypothetical protein